MCIRDSASFDVVGVNKRVGVSFEHIVACILRLSRAAKPAPSGAEILYDLGDAASRVYSLHPLTLFPAVLGALEPDVAARAIKRSRNRKLAVRNLRTVDAAPREQRSKLRDPDAENLLRENVVDPLLQIGNPRFESINKPVHDLTQKYTALRKRCLLYTSRCV